jgi:hypothetical protein
MLVFMAAAGRMGLRAEDASVDKFCEQLAEIARQSKLQAPFPALFLASGFS